MPWSIVLALQAVFNLYQSFGAYSDVIFAVFLEVFSAAD
jgi:hypothetical protein